MAASFNASLTAISLATDAPPSHVPAVPALADRRPYPQPNSIFVDGGYKNPIVTDRGTVTFSVTLRAARPITFNNKDSIPFFLDTSHLAIGSSNHTIQQIKIVATEGMTEFEYRVDPYSIVSPSSYPQSMSPLNTEPRALSSTHALGPCTAVITFGSTHQHNLLQEAKPATVVAPVTTDPKPAEAVDTGTDQNLYIGIDKSFIARGVEPFRSAGAKSHRNDMRRVVFSIMTSQSECAAQPVAWLLGTNMPQIIAANKDDPQHIFIHNTDSIVVKEATFNKYFEDVTKLVEIANRKFDGFICLNCVPDTHSPSPAFIRSHQINPTVAAALPPHFPSITIEITVYKHDITHIPTTSIVKRTTVPYLYT